MEISIREAVPADLEVLVRFHGQFMAHHIDCDDRFSLRPGAREQWRERIRAAIDDPETLVLIAETPPDFVGCAYTLVRSGAMDFDPEKIGYLCDVFLEPSCRRRGIARRFLSSAQNWLRARDIHTIEVSWAVRSEEAQFTWPDLGFHPISISGKLEF